MVIVKLCYGLGNQMFQYAFGRRISLETGLEVKYDPFWYQRAQESEFRPIQLSAFNCSLNFATEEEIAVFYKKGISARIKNKINRLIFPYHKQKVVYDVNLYHFEEHLLAARDQTYYSGYWLNEHYFKSIKDILSREFTINRRLEGKNLEIQKDIEKNWDSSVCLHIRRGDFVGNEIFDLNGPEYFMEAVRYISGIVKNPVFYIFSNDPVWVKSNVQLDSMVIVDQNDEDNSFYDFQLMRSCKHFIISNSTFSWWPAWLSSDPDQIKIAPAKWINLPQVKNADIVPSDWIRI